MKKNVCAIFDIGKTNKKIFLFDDNYKIVWEKSQTFDEILDEDGSPCEDLESLTQWVLSSFNEVVKLQEFEIVAVNFSAYGASFVHIDENNEPLTPLYNYLKPYPELLQKLFYSAYGGEDEFSRITASPILGSLNSGMQLYRLKYEKPHIFEKIKYSLHLPQYLSFLITGQFFTDFTSVGCHTNLWDFIKMKYHRWTTDEMIEHKFAPFHYAEYPIKIDSGLSVGIGLHDSSSAIIPYLLCYEEPFVLLSTGTWSISINPFNSTPLTTDELQNDCLCFLNYRENPIKASRLFAGYEHEIQIKRLAEHFNVPQNTYQNVHFNEEIIEKIKLEIKTENDGLPLNLKDIKFKKRDLSKFKNYEEAYHQLIFDIITLQIPSTQLVIQNSPVKKIFVDGGFSNNPIFMNLLSNYFTDLEVYAASIPQASALGAAVVIHPYWNQNPIPQKLITLKRY
ncbi:MAG: FGGY-family carbohydrate kinase [Spirosomataceae bacterium]